MNKKVVDETPRGRFIKNYDNFYEYSMKSIYRHLRAYQCMLFRKKKTRLTITNFVSIQQTPSLGSQKESPNSKMDTSDMDDGRRISPASNASRDHMPFKSELELGMSGLHHNIPPQLLPVSPFYLFFFVCEFRHLFYVFFFRK